MDEIEQLLLEFKADKCFTVTIHYMPASLWSSERWGAYYSYDGSKASAQVEGDTPKEALKQLLDFVKWQRAEGN